MSIHRWLTGFFLLLLMLVVLGLGSWMFAARSFQQHFAQVSGNANSVFSAQAVTQTRHQIAALEAASAPNEMRLAGLQHQIDQANADSDKLVAQLNDGAKVLSAKVAPIEAQAKIKAAGPQDETYVAVASRIGRLGQTSGVDQAQVRTLSGDLEKLSALNDQIVSQEDSTKQIEADARALQVSLNDNRETLLSAKGQFGANFDQVENELVALQKSSPLGWGEYLAEIHPAFLSAMLVMSMGALGSLLFLFPAYIANRPGMTVTFDTIIVRTVFGMVVAFAFAIVYHLGLALASATGGAASTIDTIQSPFIVAGLGIVAGVMGDDIAKWIHDRGAYLFKSNDGGTFADIARSTVTGAASRVITPPTKSDLPSGGLANPHGGPGDPS